MVQFLVIAYLILLIQSSFCLLLHFIFHKKGVDPRLTLNVVSRHCFSFSLLGPSRFVSWIFTIIFIGYCSTPLLYIFQIRNVDSWSVYPGVLRPNFLCLCSSYMSLKRWMEYSNAGARRQSLHGK